MTTREQAMQWWNGLFEYINPSGINKSALTEKYFGKERRYQSLWQSEIEEIWRKEVKTGNEVPQNIYLNRLKEQYKLAIKEYQTEMVKFKVVEHYNAMRLFCLDTQLVSFNDIEAMEYEVNKEINNQAIQDSIDLDSWSK